MVKLVPGIRPKLRTHMPNREFSQQLSKTSPWQCQSSAKLWTVILTCQVLSMFQKYLYSIYSYIIVYFLAQPQEIQLIHTKLAVSIYLKHNETLCAKIWTGPSPKQTIPGQWTTKFSTYLTKTSTSCSCNFMCRRKMHKLNMLLTHVSSIQDAAGSHYVARLPETKRPKFSWGHVRGPSTKNEDVLGLVVGSWARFPFFSVASTQTWHKSAVTHHFQAP